MDRPAPSRGAARGVDADPRHPAERRLPRWLRVVLPAALILVWLVAGSIGGPYFGRVGEVSSNDQTTYLPASADATQVQRLRGEFSDSDAIPAVLVFATDDGSALTDAQQDAVARAVDGLASIPGVDEGTSPLIPSEDGAALEAFAPIASDADVGDAVVAVSAALREAMPAGVSAYVTGPAGFSADLIEAFSGIDGLLLIVAIAAVFVILIVVYRSLLLPLAVLGTSLFALTVALLTVWWLARAGVLLLSGQTQGILFILVIGAATDYSLLYVSRYREALRANRDRGVATRVALRGSIEPIVASGGTVIAGLLCLLLSDLKSNSTLGPVAAIGIAFAMLAALTLLPSLLFAFGRAAFWPRRPAYDPEAVAAEHGVHTTGWWARVGGFVRRSHRAIWVITTLVLLAGSVGIAQLQADGVPQSELVLGTSEARDGQQVLGRHFAAGSGSPVLVVADETALQAAADVLLASPGVDSVTVVTADAVGSAPVTADGVTSYGPGAAPEPTVVDGQVLLQGTLADAADSDAAVQTVRDIRQIYADDGMDALVGGVTATAVDTRDAAMHDRNLIIPVVLAVILVILMLLLRSIVAPLLLIGTTVLSFAAALGVSAWVFNDVFDFVGADPVVPLFGFVFLVALGIDYNIFLATRVREESLVHGTRQGVLRGLAVTGGVITSAGLVLAATFAALAVLPILFLAQLAFIVAFGVLLDTFVVRALLVPALFYDLGRVVWWPSRLWRGGSTARRR